MTKSYYEKGKESGPEGPGDGADPIGGDEGGDGCEGEGFVPRDLDEGG